MASRLLLQTVQAAEYLLLEEAPEIAVPGRRMWLWPSVAAMLLVLLGLVSVLHFREKPPAEPRVVRFTIPLPERGILGQSLSLSPDGRRLAFIVSGESGIRLWVRALDSLQSHLLVGATAIRAAHTFWYAEHGHARRPFAGEHCRTLHDRG